MRRSKKCYPQYKPMEKSLLHDFLIVGFFVKSAEDQKNLKVGVVVTWVTSIVQKNIHCHSDMP